MRKLILTLVLALLSGCAKEEISVPMEKIDPVRTVSLSITGDLLFEQDLYDSQDNYQFGTFFDQIKPYLQGDLVIGNQEVPIGGKELGVSGIAYTFNAPEEVAQQLPDVGFDVLTMANNHSYDMGYQGVVNTLRYLNENGIQTIGLYENQEASEQIQVVEKNGIKIAILAYTYDTNVAPRSEHDFIVKTFLNENHEFDQAHQEMLRNDVERAKEVADVVIASMHWGREFTYELNQSQIEASHLLNEAGVDLIIGNHAHCLQPMEELVHENGNKTLVFYSLGNFVSACANVERASLKFTNMYEIGGIVNLEIRYNCETDEVTIENPVLTPFVNHFEDGYTHFALIPLKDYSEEMAASHLQRQYSEDFNVEWLKQEVFGLYEGKVQLDLQ